MKRPLSEVDPEVARMILDETARQAHTLELIASENFASEAILEACGSVLTNKYAEGYPGRRYYAGCRHVDRLERLACRRAMQLFGAEHANVQPHSGTQANSAAYLAVLDPGEQDSRNESLSWWTPVPRSPAQFLRTIVRSRGLRR